jgi:transposase-like protein
MGDKIRDRNQLDFLSDFHEEEQGYICSYCGEYFEKGRVYPVEGRWYSAERMLNDHLRDHDLIQEVMKLPRSSTGLTEVQETLIPLLHEGMKDDEIAKRLGITASTVRNHRFRLREKEKQARLFIRVMEALNLSGEETVPPHRGATMVDDRYGITALEEERVIKAHMTEEGAIRIFPAKEKKKIVVLKKVSENFKTGTRYTEKEVNRVLMRIYDDHVLLRRYLIEYGFMDRTKDGSIYMRR